MFDLACHLSERDQPQWAPVLEWVGAREADCAP